VNEAEDRAYLEEIGPMILALMRTMQTDSPGLDYFILVDRVDDITKVRAVPCGEAFAKLQKTETFMKAIKRRSPASLRARWLILSRDGVAYCVTSVTDVNATRVKGVA
jgi:hypothetical protein